MTAILIAVASFSLTCCGALDSVEITVELPEPPSLWPSKLSAGSYLIRYLESARSVGEIEVAPGIRSVLLRLPKLAVVPVIALPQFGRPPAVLHGSGAVFPRQLEEGDRLSLTWAEGFLAQLLLECAVSGDSMQAVNTPKLQLELLDRSDGDPWRLDFDALKSAIVNETLAFRSLKLLPRHDVTMEVKPGIWIGGNPLSLSGIDCTSGEAVFSDLPEGVHSFFLVDGNERIDISVRSTGWTAINTVTGAGSTGNW